MRKNQEEVIEEIIETTTENTKSDEQSPLSVRIENAAEGRMRAEIARCKGTIFAAGKGTVRLSIAAGKAIETFRGIHQVIVNGKRKPLTDKQLSELLEIDDSTLSRHSRIYRASVVAPAIRHLASANVAHTLSQVILHKSMIQHPDLCRMLIERNL